MRDDIRPGEILDLLKAKISDFDFRGSELEIGKVIQTGDGIAQVWGLKNIMAGELVEVETDEGTVVTGMVMNLEEETVGIILFSDFELVREGCLVRRTNKVAMVPAGDELLGRVVDPLGNPLDGLGPIAASENRPVEAKGPGIINRQNVLQPLQTGIKAIDAMIPIGRGQRELIIGDRRTGKTTIAVDTILNQKGGAAEEQVHCFYVAIGQKRSSVVQLLETFRKHGVMEYTTIVAATASDPAALQYLAPYSATAMAEYFRDNGKHALVIFDDLTKHSQAYRELSLLMRRSPGREAYPGDIFYLHSRLLERAAKMSDAEGGGSLTALPIVETQEGDVSAYIPTNIISITDGQIFLEANLFNSGLRPAINVGISVSRVGGDAQIKAMKQSASSLRIDLAQFRELAAFMQFSSDLDPATKKQLNRGERLTEILKQHQYSPIDVFKQVMILKAGISGRLDRYPTAKLLLYESELFAYLDGPGSEFMEDLREAGRFDDQLEQRAKELFDAFEEGFHPESMESDIDSGYTVHMAMAMSQQSGGIHRDMLKLVERITSRDLASPTLEKELEQIISGTDVQEKDRFENLIRGCPFTEFEKSDHMDDVFRHAAKIMSKSVQGIGTRGIYQKLVEREKKSSTALMPFFALPHIIVEGKNQFQMLMVRSKRGIRFSENAPEVNAMFFLAGSMDQRHFHLVVISTLAQIVQHQRFAQEWQHAETPEQIRSLLLDIKREREKEKQEQ